MTGGSIMQEKNMRKLVLSMTMLLAFAATAWNPLPLNLPLGASSVNGVPAYLVGPGN